MSCLWILPIFREEETVQHIRDSRAVNFAYLYRLAYNYAFGDCSKNIRNPH